MRRFRFYYRYMALYFTFVLEGEGFKKIQCTYSRIGFRTVPCKLSERGHELCKRVKYFKTIGGGQLSVTPDCHQ